MGATESDGIDQRAIGDLLAAGGVKTTPAEAEAVARALVGISAAAAVLVASPSFDDTAEGFFRLLESDSGGGAEV